MQTKATTLLLAFLFALLGCAASEIDDEKPKFVAFTAALRPTGMVTGGWGSMGPFQHDELLIHGTVITNIGEAYNSTSGIFTAPYAGVYYFTFTSYAWVRAHYIGAGLFKNNEEVVRYEEWQDKGDNEDYATNGATLLLNEGDQITIRLLKGCIGSAHLTYNVSTFTGFLLQRY